MPQLDLNVILGIAGGIIGLGVYFRTANLNTLKTEVESLRRQVGDLETKYKALEVERDAARRELVSHYTARTEISEENRELAAENRELHKMLHQRDEQIIELQKR